MTRRLLIIAALMLPLGAGAHDLNIGVLEVAEAVDGTLTVTSWTGQGAAPTVSVDHAGVRLNRLSDKTDVLVRIQRPDGAERTQLVRGRNPVLAVRAHAGGMVRLGAEHMLFGLDHLLFVLALVLLVTGLRRLVWTATAFTVGHSTTLALAVLGVVTVSPAVVEVLIALSLVILARELIVQRPTLARRQPALVAGGFGLLHGLGFAGALTELGLPADAIPWALLQFNVGVELGQLLFIAALLGALWLLRRLSERNELSFRFRGASQSLTLAAYGIGSVAAAWTLQRVMALALVALVIGGCKDDEPPVDVPPVVPDPPATTVDYTEDREPCADRNPLRNVYFGDTHIHTALSFDAYVHQTRMGPGGAYRFARGEEVLLPPLDAEGNGTRPIKLERPLDFAAVTDHAEFLAEVKVCITPGSKAYDAQLCQDYREGGQASYAALGIALTDPKPKKSEAICGAGAADCVAEAAGVWGDIQAAAEQHYDRTAACEFTTFIAYEYSGSTNLSNLHRNVIFRNEKVPPPVTYFEEPTPHGLWAALRTTCLDAGTGCDVLAIPHNPNWSNGNMFAVEYPGAADADAERDAALARVAIEPLVEIYQHKGDSECRGGFDSVLGEPDELCDFEKLRPPGDPICEEGEKGAGAMLNQGCISRLDFVREVLKEGLAEQARIGGNPFKLGIIAATDSHAAIPGHVSEQNFKGHLSANDDEPEEALKRSALTPGGIIDGPGGLAAVWALENSRDAIFEAMRRKETYGTSGPRIVLRFFGGWDYPAELCRDPALLEIGFDRGVPMGGDLPAPPDGVTAPSFVVSALRDPSDSATQLQRVQIIKGWLAADGKTHEKVFDVAGDADNGASVDTTTCARSGPGDDALCAVWTDPDFDPAQNAMYYARVVENPSCRWSTWWCNGIAGGAKPDVCDDPDVPKTVQERAWSSPVWWTAL